MMVNQWLCTAVFKVFQSKIYELCPNFEVFKVTCPINNRTLIYSTKAFYYMLFDVLMETMLLEWISRPLSYNQISLEVKALLNAQLLDVKPLYKWQVQIDVKTIINGRCRLSMELC